METDGRRRSGLVDQAVNGGGGVGVGGGIVGKDSLGGEVLGDGIPDRTVCMGEGLLRQERDSSCRVGC